MAVAVFCGFGYFSSFFQIKGKIPWYNPPFNLACTINLGKKFLKLIDKQFHQKTKRKDKLEKRINRHTIKLSYSGTQNMERIIQSHNSKLLKEKRKITKPTKNCNCKGGIANCPVGGECLTSAVVYTATITTSDGEVKHTRAPQNVDSKTGFMSTDQTPTPVATERRKKMAGNT